MKYETQLSYLFGSGYVIHRRADGIMVIPLLVGNTYSGNVMSWNISASVFGVYLNFGSSRSLNSWLRVKFNPLLMRVHNHLDTELVLTFGCKHFDEVSKLLRFKKRKASFLGNVKKGPTSMTLAPVIARITIGG